MGALLEKAKAHVATVAKRRPQRPVTEDEVELTQAWLRGEISMTAMVRAFDYVHTANMGYRIAMVMKKLHQEGRLLILPKGVS